MPPTRRLLRWLAVLPLLAAVGWAALWAASRHPAEPVRAGNSTGDAVCLSCHAEKGSFQGTAHHLTSRPPTRASIAGSFAPGENVLRTSNPYLHYRMDAAAGGFFQTAVMGIPPDTGTHSERVALVVGSGRKGQTYLYWRGDQLFELPVSYWTALGTWVNSPGYPDGTMNFDRPVAPRCLECHATRLEPVADSQAVNRYRPAGEVLGITCEKCHGAGREHVEREKSPLRALLARAVVNPARLSRERQVEGCALCHGGLGEPRAEPFSYVPGEPLGEYLHLRAPSPDEPVDVHGNQVALLERSLCFRSSQMTCTTCHDVHRTERSPAALSGRCLTCHQEQSCGLFPERGHELAGRCVDCHMPKLTSNTIISAHEGAQERPQVRTHWIRVYPAGASLRAAPDRSIFPP